MEPRGRAHPMPAARARGPRDAEGVLQVRAMRVAVLAVAILTACSSGPGRSAEPAPTAPSGAVADVAEPGLAASGAAEPAVAGDGGASGGPITVVGADAGGPDDGALAVTLADLAASTGLAIELVEVDDPDREFVRRLGSDDPGDILLVSSVAALQQAALDRSVRAVPRAVDSAIGADWPGAWTAPARLGDVLYGVPVAASVESLLWYQPERFRALGVDVPESWIELTDAVDELVDAGVTPFCGFVDARAEARAFVDWAFDLLLRSFEPAVYDDYLAGRRPLDDREMIDLWVVLRDLWLGADAGFGVLAPAEDGVVPDATEALVAGACAFVRGGVEVAASMGPNARFADGTADSVDVIIMPGPRGNVPVVADVTYAASTVDRPEVWRVVEQLGSGGFATARRRAQGEGAERAPAFLSAAMGQDAFGLGLLELSLLDLATRATETRERWSELLPQAVQFALVDGARDVLDGERRITAVLEDVADLAGT